MRDCLVTMRGCAGPPERAAPAAEPQVPGRHRQRRPLHP